MQHVACIPTNENQTRTLLIVDDEKNVLQALKRTFRKADLRVLTAQNAREGMNIIEAEDVQVVLSDFRMPNVSGGDFVRDLKHQHPDIVSLILSGYADFSAVTDVMNSGSAFKFLSKPWDNQQLIAEVDTAFVEYYTRREQQFYLNSEEADTFGYRESIVFERTVDALIGNQVPFAVSVVHLHDLHFALAHVSDRMLQAYVNAVSQAIIAKLPAETEVFRTEFDKMMVVTPRVSSENELQTELFALHQCLTQLSTRVSDDIQLRSSIAYAFAPHDGRTARELMLNLRIVMNPEVQGSQPVKKFDPAMLNRKRRELNIQRAIGHAITDNEFSLYFQPKVDLASGQIQSAEVLMRWQHKTLGWVSPAEFINLSELDGQIEALGSWLIENGVRQIAQLVRRHPNIETIALNVSARQLANRHIIDQFTHLLDKYDLDPSYIEIEVTESCVMEDMVNTSKILWQLKLLGMSIAIDDFGTGYSSFAYLSKLPIDILKLDKVLIDDIHACNDTYRLIASMVKLCRNLGIRIVAEGVESESQCHKLREMGCDSAQGFHFARAVRQDEFERLLLNQPFALPKAQ